MSTPPVSAVATAPRLLISFSELQALRARVAAGHPGVRDRAERLRQECVAELDRDPAAAWEQSRRRGGWSWELEATRGTVRRTWALCLGWLVFQDERFARRARRELAWLADRPRWIGTDHDRPGERGYALETGEACLATAIGLDWLSGVLTEDERQAARRALRERGILPYLHATTGEGGPARWYRKTNNWNPVCNGGAIVGALALDDELTEPTIHTAREGLEAFLAALPADGGYHESTSYWTYAFAFVCYAGAALRSARGDDLGILGRAEVREAPRYYMAFVPAGEPSGFGDMSVGRRGWRAHTLYLIARLHDRPEYSWYQDRFGEFHPLDLLWRDPERALTPPRQRLWAFASTGWTAVTSDPTDPDQRYLSVKGGDLSAPHAHLDAGSLVVRAHGRTLVSELGAGRYAEGYFASGERNFFLSTGSHNTILIDGCGQRRDGVATVRAEEREDGDVLVEVDASSCYEPPLEVFRRRVLFVGNSYWVVLDEVRCARKAEIALLLQTLGTVRLVTAGRAEIVSGDVVLDVLWDGGLADAETRSVTPEGAAELPAATLVSTLRRSARSATLSLVTVLVPRRAGESSARAMFTTDEVNVWHGGPVDAVRYRSLAVHRGREQTPIRGSRTS